MSFLCEFIFGILIIELGLNLHGFNMEADNQLCNQNPSISIQVFKCLGRGQNCAGFCVLHKSMGWFPQEKIKDRIRKIFCKDPPSRPCSGKANTEPEGCLCPRAESDTQSCGLAFHWGCPPAVLSWSVPRKGGQRSQVCSSAVWVEIALVSLLCLPEEKLAQPPWDTSPRHGNWCHSVQRPQVTCPSCHPALMQLHIPGCAVRMWSLSHTPSQQQRQCGHLWAEAAQAAQMCGTEADGLPQAEIYDLLKSPRLDGCFFFSYKSNNGRTELILNIFREWACCCLFLCFLCSRKQHVGWKHALNLLRKQIKYQ